MKEHPIFYILWDYKRLIILESLVWRKHELCRAGTEAQGRNCLWNIYDPNSHRWESHLQAQAIKPSTRMDKIWLVRASHSGHSLLSGLNALLTALVTMARVCNSWKQNCNLSVCSDSLWVLVYSLTYFCLRGMAATLSWDLLPWSIAESALPAAQPVPPLLHQRAPLPA